MKKLTEEWEKVSEWKQMKRKKLRFEKLQVEENLQLFTFTRGCPKLPLPYNLAHKTVPIQKPTALGTRCSQRRQRARRDVCRVREVQIQ